MNKPTPVKSYTAPEIPTLADVKDDSAFLQTLPKRWRKCAAVLTCMGVIGGVTLAAPPQGWSDSAAQPSLLQGQEVTYTMTDALAILRQLVGLSELSAEQIQRFDFWGDGNIKMANALQILRSLVKLPTNAPYFGVNRYATTGTPTTTDTMTDKPTTGTTVTDTPVGTPTADTPTTWVCEFCGNSFPLCDGLHYGGTGISIYMTTATEQETLNITTTDTVTGTPYVSSEIAMAGTIGSILIDTATEQDVYSTITSEPQKD
ncbi:MAG: hypothetical protein FWG45_04590 [Oscillospiraceae bacterium]|nr:hypothetical protein [Oscillospiraceae bacterium]